jgi:copper chaperone CopZ
MSHYIHHVPGRLRVRSLQIKRNGAVAADAKRALESMEGVLVAEVSTVTGSIVVNYDTEAVSSGAILITLRERGYITEVVQLKGTVTERTGSAFTSKVADTLVNKVVETVLERSAVALVAALI